DDLARVAECDWIVEAIVERLDLKRDLYAQLDAVRRPGTAVTSNTSTIPLADLVAGRSAAFARDFFITHFFNPPRFMRLLEIVGGDATDADLVRRVSEYADRALGKTVLSCKDRPGFIANRLGVYWLQLGIVAALEEGLTVEQADAVIGIPFGIPRTGVFGLVDLVGVDLIPHTNASLTATLPPSDPIHAAQRDLDLIRGMIASGHTGRKGKGGFYRTSRAGGVRTKEAIDLQTGQYRPEQTPSLPELASAGRDLRQLLGGDSPACRYAWRVIGRTLAYAASLVPEVTDGIEAIDAAMRLGYNWQFGPFELADRIGVDWLVEHLEADAIEVPPLLRLAAGRGFYSQGEPLGLDGSYHTIVRPPGVMLLADIKRGAEPLRRNRSAALWDVGDRVVCLEFTTKANTIDTDIIAMVEEAVALVPQRHKAMVIYNEGANFSFGANLAEVDAELARGNWAAIDTLVTRGQRAYQALRDAPFPVVGAPSGMALGGGCEILLHCDAIQAHAETYMGLVECGIGLIPAWGGCLAMLERWTQAGKLPRGPMPVVQQVFELISTATVTKSAVDARAKLFLRPGDGITMNRDRLLADAKAKALALTDGYVPPAPLALALPGPAGAVILQAVVQGLAARKIATEHDTVVAAALSDALTGGSADPTQPVGTAELLELERVNFERLLRHEKTRARIAHTLATGRPLRN
ncbi:MAG: enoyl-CoA hydratase/isomerase family protein, partial [Acetobacteraceae bacterium]|nr:enoyl-CoA hydratase/isomerase family protein [Acetobacteraceae bacterium]